MIDEAFCLSTNPYLIKSCQSDPNDSDLLLINRDATSVRQLSEWGMRMIQSKFPRVCYDKIPCEEDGQRKITLHLMVLLYNFTTSKMGMNQILNTFLPRYSKDSNYWLNENHVDPTANELANGLLQFV